ncbi:hypothetical protein I7P29_08495, partial [Neisseria meningitidis]|nr:hypothetical protein [Neisseria meningitidis]
PYAYFFDGRVGYDVQYMNKDELIADILKNYERYLMLLDDVGQKPVCMASQIQIGIRQEGCLKPICDKKRVLYDTEPVSYAV